MDDLTERSGKKPEAACDALEGRALDRAVARAEGEDTDRIISLRYSNSWRDAGKIIERERISVEHCDSSTAPWDPTDGDPPAGEWCAQHPDVDGPRWGPTPLIAAMRAYVASKREAVCAEPR